MSLKASQSPPPTVGPNVRCHLSQDSVLSIPYTIYKDWAEMIQGSESEPQSLLDVVLSEWKLGLNVNSLHRDYQENVHPYKKAEKSERKFTP